MDVSSKRKQNKLNYLGSAK